MRRNPSAAELDHPDNVEVHAQSLLLRASSHRVRWGSGSRWSSRAICVCVTLSRTTAVSSIGLPVAHAESVLEVIQEWAGQPESESAELAAFLVKGYLQLEIHGTRWGGRHPGPVVGGLRPDRRYRRSSRARNGHSRELCPAHGARRAIRQPARALQEWLRGYDKLDPELLERWVPQLEKESQVLTDCFSKVASTTPHLPVRAVIEQQGWRLWSYPEEGFAQRMGGRLLRSLPADAPYALWKALHEDILPVTTVAPDESTAGKERREYLLALTSRDTGDVEKSARALFDELDLPRPEALAWPALFVSVLQAQPKHSLQPQVDLYLEEFAVRHPAEAWSLVTETLAEGPLRAILPRLLTGLRRHDSARWQDMVQQAAAGDPTCSMPSCGLCGPRAS